MKPAPFAYCRPASAADAVQVLAEHGDDAKVLAGGQSLVPLLNFRLARPALLVDVHRIPELLAVTCGADHLQVGAGVPQARLEGHGDLAASFPALADALPLVGHVSTRTRGTVGGSLAHADPAAELPALAVALDAQLTVLGVDGARTLNAREFFVDHFTTRLSASDLLVSAGFPVQPAGTGQSWVEMAYRHGDFALVGCAAVVQPSTRQLRLVFAGVASTPWEAPELPVDWDRPLLAQVPSIADAARSACTPSRDQHATSDYRRRLVGVLARRGLEVAARRAEQPPADQEATG